MSQKQEDDKKRKGYPWTARQRRQKRGNRLTRKQMRKALQWKQSQQ